MPHFLPDLSRKLEELLLCLHRQVRDRRDAPLQSFEGMESMNSKRIRLAPSSPSISNYLVCFIEFSISWEKSKLSLCVGGGGRVGGVWGAGFFFLVLSSEK